MLPLLNPLRPSLLSPSFGGLGLGSRIYDLAQRRPTLDLRFADNKSLTDATTGQNLVTFTRASSGTYVDSQGVIRTATTNLLLRSEEFDNAAWVKTNSSANANTTTSPAGLLTADSLIENTAVSTQHYVTQNASISANTLYTAIIYVKANTRLSIRFGFLNSTLANGAYAHFNASTGVISSQVTAGTASSVTYGMNFVGSGWYRCRVTCIVDSSSTTGTVFIGLVDGSNNATYTGDGTSGIYLWGAQLEQSSTVGEYIPTTSTINSAPRFDHNPTTGESLGLLVEEQRTNSIRNNTMVGAVAGTPGTLPTNWSISSSVNGLTRTITEVGTVNGINYIDVRFAGTATATANLNYLNDSSITAPALNGQTWTFSSWVSYTKTSGADPVLRLEIDERDSAGNFLAATQTNILPNQVLTRYSTTRINNNALTAFELAYIQAAYVSGQSYDFTLRIGLPQLEQGAFATSVIPTTTAAATRSADVASITGSNFSSWYRQDEGTVFAEYRLPAAGIGIVNIDDGTANNNIPIFVGAAVLQAASANAIVAGVNNGRLDSGGSFVANSLTRCAYAIKVADRALSANGATATASATPAAMPVITQLQIQGGTVFAGAKGGTIRRLAYFPVRLANETLQRITQ